MLIRGGQLVTDNSSIEAHTLGDQDGKGIDIVTNESVTVKGDVFAINTPTFGSGKSGNIQITTPRLEVAGSFIDTSGLGNGTGGDIEIQAEQVTLLAGATLSSTAFGGGDGGSIRVTAHDSVTVAGNRTGDFSVYGIHLLKNYGSQILANSFNVGSTGDIQIITSHLVVDDSAISVESVGFSDARNLTIEADSVTLKNGGVIASDTFGDHAGGNITLNVTGEVMLTGRRTWITVTPPPFNLVFEGLVSSITSSTFGKGPAGRITLSATRLVIQEGAIVTMTAGQGSAGAVHLTVNALQLEIGGTVASSSGFLLDQMVMLGTGDGGEVHIVVAGNLRIQGRNFLGFPSNLSSNTLTTGHGGNVEVHANYLQLSDGGMVTANSLGMGNAGEVMIQTNTLEIFDHGQITTSAQQAGGGNILVTVADLLSLRQGQVTTSVAGGTGNGGNLTIENPRFVVMNHGQVIAQADAGNGGNIRLIADNLLKTPDSLINASSRLGINGQVLIAAPDETISGSLLTLATTFTEVSSLLPRPCTALSFEEFIHRSHLIVNSIAGNSPWPNDLRPSPILLSIQASPNFTEATVSKEKKAESIQRLAWLTGCHQ